MFSKLADWFAGGGDVPEEVDDRRLHLASAILLFEVANADHQLDSAELVRIERVLSQRWDLPEEELRELLSAGRREAEISASLHQHVDLINRHFSAEQKVEVVRGLWQIAFADGQLHHHEEHLVRRIADLLYVPHKDFIRTRHSVAGET